MVTVALQPNPQDASAAERALERIQAHQEDPVYLRFPEEAEEEDDVELVVPSVAIDLLKQILAHLAAGHGVSIVPTGEELTTQQAADLLNVSRPYLIALLESGEIAYRRVGKHRRISTESFLEYLRRDNARRRDAANELSALTQQMGLVR